MSCRRGYRDLFQDLSLQLQPGQALRVEGQNGMGKTSLLRIMSGLAQPLEGEVQWQGRKIQQLESGFQSELLFIGHKPGIKYDLSPVENLAMANALQGSNGHSIEDALNQLGLYGFEDIPCGQLSAGQKRRVALAQLFLTRARCWILDEPYTSLDVAAVAMLEACFDAHLAAGGLLVLTSHQPVKLAASQQFRLALPSTQVEPVK